MRGGVNIFSKSLISDRDSYIRYELQNGLGISKVDKGYLINTPRGVVILNNIQYEILMAFNEEPSEINEVICRYENSFKKEKLEALINKFVFEKLIIKEGANFVSKKTFRYFFKKLTELPLPRKVILFIPKKILSKINIKFMTISSMLIVLMSIFFNATLINYTGFSWSNSPRILAFFFIGILFSVYHELWMAAFVIKNGGEHMVKFKIRFLFGIFISIVVNWSYLLTLERTKRVKLIVLVNLFTAALCGFFSGIGYLFMILGNKYVAFYCCSFSIIGYSYILINLWPFLFKGDGYNIFCFMTDTARLRNYFFKIIYKLIKRERINFIEKYKMKYYVIWGMFFVLTLIFLEYALSKGIRLRI